MADFNAVATQFVTHYYNTFDTDRKLLASLYRDDSKLTFQDDAQIGSANIANKLSALPFTKVVHKYNPPDAQPTANSIVILVTGQLLVDDSDAPLSYSQTFVLGQDAAGQWYVQNDIFKLVVF
ncbi:hypothetical protein OQA88_10090 [Cercophora sp. LCS_1]